MEILSFIFYILLLNSPKPPQDLDVTAIQMFFYFKTNSLVWKHPRVAKCKTRPECSFLSQHRPSVHWPLHPRTSWSSSKYTLAGGPFIVPTTVHFTPFSFFWVCTATATKTWLNTAICWVDITSVNLLVWGVSNNVFQLLFAGVVVIIVDHWLLVYMR